MAAVQDSDAVRAVTSVCFSPPGAPGGASAEPSHLSPLIRQPTGAAIGPVATNQKLYGSLVPCAPTVPL